MFVTKNVSVSTYLKRGTVILSEAKLPIGVEKAINDQLAAWTIEPLGTAAVASSAADIQISRSASSADRFGSLAVST